ncbi:MAG: DNA topoisomerase VI subunit B [Thaumarchaeota archaeon]|nr:DNA topoisomerase VI subunit B [Nitrososphaerota archaeon]
MNKTEFQEISPSEFFYRNRDLAGFSNPSRALYSTIRELVENSLDACDLFSIYPKVYVRLTGLENQSKEDVKEYTLVISDNGSGIPNEKIPLALGKVFFGSKFKLKQSRGMFGMGGTMSMLYAQITTNKPITITSSVDGKTYHRYRMIIDIEKNQPTVLDYSSGDSKEWRGTRIELNLMGDYLRSASRIVEYFNKIALVTPYAEIAFLDPMDRLFVYAKGTDQMPTPPTEVLPHPLGVDVEGLRRAIRSWKGGGIRSFLIKNFHRVGPGIADKFLEYVMIDPTRDPRTLSSEEMASLTNSLQTFGKFLPPDGRCLSPLGREILLTGINKELNPEFADVAIRAPAAYGGFPFVVEVGLAYGGQIKSDKLLLFRFANRIPLLYDEGSDIAWKVLMEDIDWNHYKVPMESPLVIITHICSTKIPYKTVGKEYISDRPEIERELKNAIKEVLRGLSLYLGKKSSMENIQRKYNIYAKYLPLIAQFSTSLADRKRKPNIQLLLGEGSLDVFT